jgi:type I restriction enzyme S subunit
MWADDGTPWVAIGDMTTAQVVRKTQRSVSPEGIKAKSLPVGEPGTILFAMYASVGAIAVLGVKATWNQAILGIETLPALCHGRFLTYWLQYLRRDLPALVRSNTQDNLNAEQVGNFPFPILSLDRQSAIANYLDTEASRIDELNDANQRMHALLMEHRQSLITNTIIDELDISGIAT